MTIANVNWGEVARLADWDRVVRIDPDGALSTPENSYAAPVYWDSQTGQTTLEHSDNAGEYTVRTYHPSEFLEPRHYQRLLSDYQNDDVAVEFWLTAITDLDDSDGAPGWALVIHEITPADNPESP